MGITVSAKSDGELDARRRAQLFIAITGIFLLLMTVVYATGPHRAWVVWVGGVVVPAVSLAAIFSIEIGIRRSRSHASEREALAERNRYLDDYERQYGTDPYNEV